MIDDPAPMQPMRRVRYYLGRCEDALDDATTALHHTPGVDAGWREEFTQDPRGAAEQAGHPPHIDERSLGRWPAGHRTDPAGVEVRDQQGAAGR